MEEEVSQGLINIGYTVDLVIFRCLNLANL